MRRAFAFFLLLAACGASDAAADADRLPQAPSACDGLPLLGEATQRLVSGADAITSRTTALTPESALAGLVPINAGYALDSTASDGSIVRGTKPMLFRSPAELAANRYTKDLSLDVDWTKDAVLLTRESPREAFYRYATDGDAVVVVTAKATPCLADADAASFASGEPDVKLYKVPHAVTTVRTEDLEERYRIVSPTGASACKRAATPAVTGGGAPSVVRGPDGLRLYFNGFSAMTGNVFFGTAADATAAFTPSGWDQAHLSSFADRGPYADVYEPFVERTDAGFRMTASVLDYTSDGKTYGQRSRVVEMTSPDGLAWSKGAPLLPDTTKGSAPARVSVDGEERLYVARDGAIVVLRRRGSDPFVEEATPALAPSSDIGAYDGLGYGAPEVARVGTKWVMFATVRWGGLSRERPFRAGIGWATSDDGLHFVRAESPLVVPELEDEAGGLASPAAVVDGGVITVFLTAINRNAEPVIKRVVCTIP